VTTSPVILPVSRDSISLHSAHLENVSGVFRVIAAVARQPCSMEGVAPLFVAGVGGATFSSWESSAPPAWCGDIIWLDVGATGAAGTEISASGSRRAAAFLESGVTPP